MHIVRFAERSGTVRCGLISGSSVTAFDGVGRIADLLALRRAEFDELLRSTADGDPTHAAGEVSLLPPVDGHTEIWAAGVTYERSREARVEESTQRSIYELVYDAPRPELFFKSVPWRLVTDGEPIAVREDSQLNVPEPELGLVMNRHAETVGYLVADDVSSRSIEGDNPLYLPQAKIYAGSMAVSAGIRPAFEVPDPAALRIEMTVRREAEIVYDGTVSTASLRRSPAELARHLFSGQPFPDGAVLSTGTGIVPDMAFTLCAGDEVWIEIGEIGTLRNPVVAGPAAMDWLVTGQRPAPARERTV
jgi:2-dehydro-3-deoxy-D-arabinonate dehydratase